MSDNIFSLAVASSLVLALIIINGFGFLAPLIDTGRLTVNFFLWPLESVLFWLRDLGLAFFAVHDLVDQNDLLTKQVSELNTLLARYEQASEENQILREALGFVSKSSLDLVPAEVISYDFFDYSQNAIINRGSNDGARVGDNVIASGGVLVGILTEVSARTSTVELITSSDLSVNARTSNGRATGIVKGEHGLGLLLENVALDEFLAIDDQVITSGLGGKFLPGLLIGRIGEIKPGQSDLFQTATIVPAVSLRTLQILFIAKSR